MATFLLHLILCVGLCLGALMIFAGAVGLVENPGNGLPFGNPASRRAFLALGSLGLVTFIVSACGYAAVIGGA